MLRPAIHSGVALACGVLPFHAVALTCADYSSYRVEGKLVYYKRKDQERVLPGIDGLTFRRLTPEGPMGSCMAGYAKDAHAVLYEGKRIGGAQAESFRLPPDWAGYAIDGRRVYAEGRAISTAVDKFRVLGEGFGQGYATDGRTVFCGADRLPGRNLVVFGHAYAKTEVAVFHECKVVNGLDPASFNVLKNRPSYGRDHKAVVLDGKVIAGADPATFEVIAPYVEHARDRKHVYYHGKIIPGADPATIKQIFNYYFRDASAVYLEGRKLEGADPATFRVSKFGIYSADRNRVYRGHEVVEDRDPETFEDLQPFYTKDKNGVYYQSKLMPMADSATFVASAMNRARDKNYVYYQDRPVQCLSERAKSEGKYCK
jgi:hypothetical protein